MQLLSPLESKNLASARQRAALRIQELRDYFEQADALVHQCPSREIVYGVGTKDQTECERCRKSPQKHGLGSKYENRGNPATLLQAQVQTQINQYKGNTEDFHPADKTDITYGVMECLDAEGEKKIFLTCSGDPTKAVISAWQVLHAQYRHWTWIVKIPEHDQLNCYSKETGKLEVIKLVQIDNPPNVCAASKLIQYAMHSGLFPVSLTEVSGRNGTLKPSCNTCTKNLIQMLCGKELARDSFVRQVTERTEGKVRQVQAEEQLSQDTEDWRELDSSDPEGLSTYLDPERLNTYLEDQRGSPVFQFIVGEFGPNDGKSKKHAEVLDLLKTEGFKNAFDSDPEANEAQVVVKPAAERPPGEKPTAFERKLANKAKQNMGTVKLAPAKEEEPRKTWKQMIREIAEN